MKQYDYYSGEPVEGSPEIMSPMGNTNMSMQYSFDPNQRMQQQMQYYNNQNYNAYPQNNFMNPPQNNGFNLQNPYQYQGFNGYQGNPAFGFIQQQNVYNPYMQQQPIYHDQVVHVDGFNTGSKAMFRSDIEDVCDRMQIDMMMEQEEAIAKRNQRFQGYFNNNGYNNYYGMPYMNNYMDTSVSMKYQRKVDELKQEAIERRNKFNKNLFMLCNNYLDQDMSEDQIDMICNGYDYVIPATVQQAQYETDRLSNMVPVDTRSIYVNHFNQVNQFYDAIFQQKDLQGFLQAQGVLHTFDLIEEEQHRRRDASRYYQGDGYTRILRNEIAKRNGIDPNQAQQTAQPNNVINNFPTLAQNSSMMEDGTISISAPPWLGGNSKHIQITNELEQHFEEDRHKF